MLVTADGEDGGSEKLNAMNAKDEKEPAGNGENEEEEGAEGDEPVYLKWEENGLDGEKYAVLPNDWPYNVPYGVRHFCVWSRVSHLSTHVNQTRQQPHNNLHELHNSTSSFSKKQSESAANVLSCMLC